MRTKSEDGPHNLAHGLPALTPPVPLLTLVRWVY